MPPKKQKKSLCSIFLLIIFYAESPQFLDGRMTATSRNSGIVDFDKKKAVFDTSLLRFDLR